MRTVKTQQHSRFQRGSGVFNCETCGRATRITHQPRDCKCCFECYELAGLENAVYDGCMDAGYVRERDSMLSRIVQHGGSEEKVRTEFKDLFAFSLPSA